MKHYFIRKNNHRLRKRLEELGFKYFRNEMHVPGDESDFLFVGEGYYTQTKRLICPSTAAERFSNPIDCGGNVELFFSLILRGNADVLSSFTQKELAALSLLNRAHGIFTQLSPTYPTEQEEWWFHFSKLKLILEQRALEIF